MQPSTGARGFQPYARPARPRYPVNVPIQPQFTGPISLAPGEAVREQLIGVGSFGQVWRGKCRGKEVAIKVLNRQDLDEKTLEEFRREVDIISKIPHPNIIQFMGACTVPGHLEIVTDFMPRGDLEDMLMNPRINLTYTTRMKMARDVAFGMNWLHKSNPVFIHRDLKTKNLLVAEDNTIKICDFGLSQVKQQGYIRDPPNGAKGTPLWMAPEILENLQFNEKCDVYSFGIILWCLLTRDEPFKEFNDFEQFRLSICRRNVRPVIPANCEPSLRNLIERCWDRNPEIRPPFEQIIEELDNIIVDYGIIDPWGRQFWREKFIGREIVPWSEFIETLNNEANAVMEHLMRRLPNDATPQQLRSATVNQLNEFGSRSLGNQRMVQQEFFQRFNKLEPNYQAIEQEEQIVNNCIRALLINDQGAEGVQDEEVTIEKFGEILQWFGPSIVGENFVLFDRIRSLLSLTWFHGDIDQMTAEDRLRARDTPGAFLVRFSGSQPGCFAISQYASAKQLEHRRITRTQDMQFQFQYVNRQGQPEVVVFPTLDSLIGAVSAQLGLIYPCPGSRFTRLTANVVAGGYTDLANIRGQ